jgi:hypothetical protein
MTVQKSIAPARIWSKLTVSDRALEALAALRTTERAKPGQIIGLIPTAGGIGLVLDTPGTSDRVFSRDEIPVLFIAADLERRLRGCVLDFVGPAGREQFTVDRRQGRKLPELDGQEDGRSSAFVASPREAPPMSADRSADATAEGRTADVVELFEDKRPEGFAFHLRVHATGRVYRCEPARDPQQPRYWCFRIFRCLPSRMVDITERPWLGAGGMTWAEVPAAADAIRADPNGWLESQQLGQLRRWMLEEIQDPEDGADSTVQ